MPVQDATPAILAKIVPTFTATTDFALNIPFTGKGYTVRRVTLYDSRLLTTGATASNALTTIGVFTGVGGTGATIVANSAALATITTNLIVFDMTVAATGISPLVNAPTLYIRTGTASAVPNSCLSVEIVIEPLA